MADLAHARNWVSTRPQGSNTNASTIDTEIQVHRVDTADRMSAQHKWDEGTGSDVSKKNDGKHLLGITGVMGEDTNANLIHADNYNESEAAGGNKVAGAIAFDTDANSISRNDGTNWLKRTPYIAYQTNSASESVTSSDAVLETFTPDPNTISGLIANNLIVIDTWALVSSLTSSQTLSLSIEVDDIQIQHTSVKAFQTLLSGSVTLGFRRTFLATSTSHTVELHGNLNLGSSKTIQGGITITIYPGDYS